MRTPPNPAPIVVIGCVLLCTAGSAQALGFGRVINVSHLGQPLNFAATLRLDADESLLRECISAEVLSGEARVPPAGVRITLEPGSDPNERMLRVTTLAQIEEPIVTVTVSAGCSGRLTRSFVTLVDPPGINLAQSDGAAPLSLPAQRVESPVAPVLTVVETANAASAPRRAASEIPRTAAAAAVRPLRPRLAGAPEDAAPEARAQAPRPRPRPATAPGTSVARRAGPRLQLDPAAPAAAASSARPSEVAALVATAASAASFDAAQALAAAASAASAADAAQRRLVAVEQSLARLREESQATQRALATVQASLEQAQVSRYTNPLVYALAALSALLACVVGLLWWRQSRTRPASQWWLAPAGSPRASAPRRSELSGGSARAETEPAVMDDRAMLRSLDEPEPAPPAARPAPPAPETVSAPAPAAIAEPPVLRRELSVEELIDLEQQADFFVVLGQDEAAIDLLMGHVRSSGGVSPLPYLKLLEIYRRRGEHEAYQRVRERFNRRFNAYAPDWDKDLAQGKTLEDYPEAMAQIQRLWSDPPRVTLSLDAALLREDENPDTFDLPAYRELLFLYSISRDLSEHPGSAAAVDLLLPLDGEEPEKPIEKLTASRLLGFAATDQLATMVDLDITTALPGPAPSRNTDFIGLVNVQSRDDGKAF